jgi:hypothetical protein
VAIISIINQWDIKKTLILVGKCGILIRNCFTSRKEMWFTTVVALKVCADEKLQTSRKMMLEHRNNRTESGFGASYRRIKYIIKC